MSASKLVRHRDLLNLLVIDRATTDELGRVEVVWMHPPAHRVLGFICKTGPLGGPKLAFNLKQIHQLGTESIVASGNAVGTNTSEVKLLESLIGLEVWSDKGAKIGKIIDCLFDLKSGVISQYLFRSDGWRGVTGGVYQLPTGSIKRFGKKRVFVSGTVTRQPQIYKAGLEDKLAKVGDRIQSRLADLTHQARDQIYQVTDQATYQVQSLTEEATQKVQTFGQQLTEETQNLTEISKQRGQSLFARVQEQARQLGEEFALEDLPFMDAQSSSPSAVSDAIDDDFVWEEGEDMSSAEADPWDDSRVTESPSSTEPDERGNDVALALEETTKNSAEPTWTGGLEDIPPEDLDDDEPWI